MIFGMTPLTLVHVLISLAGIATGFVVIYGFFTSKRLPIWTLVFLVDTALTSITGFFFPFFGLLPSHILGILSIVTLGLAALALYPKRLAGPWRATYVVNAVLSQWFNVFVLVVQLFKHVPALFPLAPTQTEPPFKIAQGAVFVLFLVLGGYSVKRFRPAALPSR